MKKIILTKENLGTVVGIFQKLMKKPISVEHVWNAEKISESVFKETEHVDLFRQATVKRHWLSNQKGSDTPLVHIDFEDGLNFLILYEGDTILLLGGAKLVFLQRNGGLLRVLEKKNIATFIQRIDLKVKENELLSQEVIRIDEKRFYDSMNEDYEEEFLSMI